jgi:hypothetical protein
MQFLGTDGTSNYVEFVLKPLVDSCRAPGSIGGRV